MPCKSPRKVRVAAILFGVAGWCATAPVHAQAVFCTNCSSEVTQLANYAQLIDQLAKQAALLNSASQNTTPLSAHVWSNGQSDITSVSALLARATSLSYTLANLDSAFSQKYTDYNSYLSGAQGSLNGQTMAGKYQQWSADTNSSVSTTLKAANLQSGQISGSEEQTLQSLQAQAQNVFGNLDAKQVGNEIAVEMVRQIQKLRQLILVDMQMKANFVQTQSDRDTSVQAAWKKFLTTPQVPTTGGERF